MKMNYKKVVLVGFAFLIIQAFWIAYDAIVPLMLVNKFGMNHFVSGIIMALDNVLAVFLLPIFGSLSDKSKHKMGKRKPFVLIGTLCAVVAFFGLSFVDYAQFKNLGEQAQMPEKYACTAESEIAHEYFWDQNYEITNQEFSKYSVQAKPVNGLDEKLQLRDYVATVLYGKPGAYDVKYDTLDPSCQQACKQWYKSIDLESSYVFTEDGYRVYKFVSEEEVKLLTFAADGSVSESAANKADATAFGATNVYTTMITEARSNYAASVTKNNPLTIIIFMLVLLITLIAMAVFRSPAVALMPDVVVPQLRSKGNAVINLMGVVGGIVILGLGMIVGTDKVNNQLMPYTLYIGCVCAVMLASLAVFMLKVKEPEWNAQMLEDQSAIEAKEAALQKGKEEQEVPENAKKQRKLSRGEVISLLLILASVAFWYMGYNAITSKYSLYAINVLGKPYNIVLMLAQGVSLVAFIPIGIISAKIGRKKMILIGVALLASAFFAANFVTRYSPGFIMYILFAVAGVGWAAINVNSFPMVVELAGAGDIGKFTGYYYTASMAAQIITPALSGIIMDLAGNMTPLFIYGTICVVASFITMLFVKHGDSKPEEKKSALEYLEGSDD
ncbi:MAG: MFS transporter [Clostridia bacterium]|nr:MFS transporter [Clostridia bacterium]